MCFRIPLDCGLRKRDGVSGGHEQIERALLAAARNGRGSERSSQPPEKAVKQDVGIALRCPQLARPFLYIFPAFADRPWLNLLTWAVPASRHHQTPEPLADSRSTVSQGA